MGDVGAPQDSCSRRSRILLGGRCGSAEHEERAAPPGSPLRTASNYFLPNTGFMANLAPPLVANTGFMANLAPPLVANTGFMANLAPPLVANAAANAFLSPTAVPATGELATVAFLVVFRVLIKDFFWMVMARSLNFCFGLNSITRLSLLHEPCQTRGPASRSAKSNNHKFLAAAWPDLESGAGGEEFSFG